MSESSFPVFLLHPPLLSLSLSLSLLFNFRLDSLLPLCALPHLRTLCLKVRGVSSLGNPLCSDTDHGGYGVFMSQSFPHLRWLDGERVEREGVKGERTELGRELGRLEAIGEDDEDEEGKREPERGM